MAAAESWPAALIDLQIALGRRDVTGDPRLEVLHGWAERQAVEQQFSATRRCSWWPGCVSHARPRSRSASCSKRYARGVLRLIDAAEFCALTGRSTTPREDRLRLLLDPPVRRCDLLLAWREVALARGGGAAPPGTPTSAPTTSP